MAVAWLCLLRPTFLFSATFLVITFPVTVSMTEAEALLKLKSSFTNAQALDSWVPGGLPCKGSDEQWRGVVCHDGIITGLRFENMGLSGDIDVDALVHVPGLRTLNVANNSFSGKLPDLSRLGVLRAMYFSGNQFSGEIPPHHFDKMDALRKLWISDNKFTGPLPPSLFQMPHLIVLHLENNQFSGPIPSFDQPTLKEINLSNNQLEGEIPETLSRFNASSFAENKGLCGKTVGIDCQKMAAKESASNASVVPPPPPAAKVDDSKLIVAAAITLSVILLSIVIVLIVRYRRREKTFDVLKSENVGPLEVQVSITSRHKEIDRTSRKGSLSSRGSPSQHGKSGRIAELVVMNKDKGVFGLPDLMKAAAEVLGNGGLGSAYKAVMADGIIVVVKRMREMNAMGKEGFEAEIRRLGALRHDNILTPLAYHYRKDEKLLVFEYNPKGSLLYLLHGDRGQSHDEFNWPARLKIVQGIARGMGYLHTELAHLELPHGNLKSSNILLGHNNEPKISEYGFCPLINNTSLAQALFAYKAPEAIQFGKVSPKSDVYCLGIIILEILTGKFPSQYLGNGKGGIDIVQWVSSAFSEERMIELLDPEIASSNDSIGEMEQLLQIGKACIESNPDQRLDMREAISRIEGIRMEGSPEAKTLQILPTLGDGFGDCEQPGTRHGSVDSFDQNITGR